MTHDERAESLTHDEIVKLLVAQESQAARMAELEQQIEWFKRQLFGSKSERRIEIADAQQVMLGEMLAAGATLPVPTITVPAHARRPPSHPADEASENPATWFDASVPVQEIRVPNPEAETYPSSAYEVVGQKRTYRLAQRPGAYVVLCY